MKPRLGRTVYCVYENSISVEEVGFLGHDSFIVYDFSDLKEFDALEWFYEDYQKTWFTSLARAKKKLLQVAYREEGEKLKVVKISDTYYEVQQE